MRLLVAVSNTALSHAIRGALNNARYGVVAVEPKDMGTPASSAAAVAAAFDEANDDTGNSNGSDGPNNEDGDGGTISGPQPAPFDIAIVDSPALVGAARSAQPSIRTLLLATTSLRRGPSDDVSGNVSSAAPGTNATPDATLRMPFSDTELLSYVEMLARESAGAGMGTMLIRGDLTLDLKNRKAYFASTHNAMPLSRLEYDILETLVRASGRFVGLDELQHAAGGSYFTQEGLVRRGIESLDRKLRNAGLIMTRRDGQYRVL